MDGYFYIIVVFLLVFKCSIYFCWYKARRQRYVTAQQRAYIIEANAVSSPGFVQNGQANAMPPGGYGHQGMVEQPVAPHYQPPVANQDKPPAYNDISQQSKGMNTTEPPPPSYFNATTFPYSTNVSGLTMHPSTTSGPRSPGTIPYSATTGGPTNPGTTPYPYTTFASGPTSLGTTPYSYPATTGGPTRPGITPYQYPAAAGAPSLGTTPYSYPATTGGPTRPGITPYQYPATASAPSLGTTPYPAGTNSGPQQM